MQNRHREYRHVARHRIVEQTVSQCCPATIYVYGELSGKTAGQRPTRSRLTIPAYIQPETPCPLPFLRMCRSTVQNGAFHIAKRPVSSSETAYLGSRNGMLDNTVTVRALDGIFALVAFNTKMLKQHTADSCSRNRLALG